MLHGCNHVRIVWLHCRGLSLHCALLLLCPSIQQGEEVYSPLPQGQNLYASCGLSEGSTFTNAAVPASRARPARICKPEHVASTSYNKLVCWLIAKNDTMIILITCCKKLPWLIGCFPFREIPNRIRSNSERWVCEFSCVHCSLSPMDFLSSP